MTSPTPTAATDQPRYSIMAIMALVVGVGAAALFALEPWGLVVGAVAIILGVLSRRELQTTPSLRGVAPSVLGCALGGLVVIVQGLPWALLLISEIIYFLSHLGG
ncbi:hypothetical protein GCM10022198_04600 [Klugiella xanthotipulae]|uniref:DUF4190 domain-containing protein n=1 Tax=Klugiella xanthotipulae TaxID=244735 RepID=A0A543HSH1_9MICO|nr:hypothetical protein [Klugiella xanthotipulae]TQM61283.1 hypothetical protein FB466_2229 [Klugiella xanthotipulae]